MANQSAGFDEGLPSGRVMDGNGDGNSLQPCQVGEKAGRDDGVYHVDDVRRKKARHESSSDESSKLSSFDDFYGTQYNDLGNSVATEVHNDLNSAIEPQFCGTDTSPHSNSVTCLHDTTGVGSTASQNAFGASLNALGEDNIEDMQEEMMGSASDCIPPQKFSEETLAFDSKGTDHSRSKHSDNPNQQTRAQPHMVTMNDRPRDYGDIHERQPPYDLAELYTVSQNCASNVTSDMGQVYETTPREASFANDDIRGHTQQKAFPCNEVLNSVAAQHPVMGNEKDSVQIACKDILNYSHKTENLLNFNINYDSTKTFPHKEAITYAKPGEDILLTSREHMTDSNQAESLTKKITSLFSRPSQYTLQSFFLRNVALGLRIGSAIFSFIVFSVIISTTEKRIAAGSTFFVKFSDYQAYNYLAAINLLTFLYSCGHLFLLRRGKPRRILSSRIKWGTSLYLWDQMLASLMISSSSSAATAAELSWHGLHNIWPPACFIWKLSMFCSRVDVAVGISFVSCLFMFLTTLSSGYRLSKLLAE